jgi:putative peptidoglycan lipid II flippase
MSTSLGGSARSTVVVMVSTLGSRVLGFLRVAVIGALFGASGNADVLNLVFNIPNNLRKLLAEGALSSAFIPVLSHAMVEDPSMERPRKVVRSVLTFQAVVLVPILLAASFFSEEVVGFILDFPEASRQLLAARLFAYLIHYTLLISIAAALMGALNAHGRFLIPALAPLLFSISVISSILIFHRELGIFSVALGVLLGGFFQVVLQIPSFRKLGFSFAPSLDLRGPDFRKVLRGWMPVVVTASIFTLNQQVSIFFASGLDSGSGSAMTNALVFWQLPFGVFGASVSTVLFPRMSRQTAEGDHAGLKESLEFGIESLALLLIPSAVLLSFLGPEVISVALQRGNFLLEHTQLTAKVLSAYCVGLFSVAAFNFLQRFFYARSDYKTPAVVAFVTLVTDVSLSLWLKETYLGVIGLGIANSVAFTLGFLLLFLRASVVIGGLSTASFASVGGRIVLSLVPVTAGLAYYRSTDPTWWVTGSSWQGLGRLFLLGAVAVAILVLLYYLLNLRPLLPKVRRR